MKRISLECASQISGALDCFARIKSKKGRLDSIKASVNGREIYIRFTRPLDEWIAESEYRTPEYINNILATNPSVIFDSDN